jgi:hypothetical protein
MQQNCVLTRVPVVVGCLGSLLLLAEQYARIIQRKPAAQRTGHRQGTV